MTLAGRPLLEAGHANGFDAGDFFFDMTFTGPETVINDLRAVGIRVKGRSAPYEDLKLKAK